MVVARLRIGACVILGFALVACGASASGPSPTAPWSVDQYGGDPADADAFFQGRQGIVMSTAPRPMGFIAWRLLHGRSVGRDAGEALATPCCDTPWWARDYRGGASGWFAARNAVASSPAAAYLGAERPGPNGTSTANCFPDAFDAATATLRDRAMRYGAASGGVKGWVAAQDAVFRGCSDAGSALPPALPGAPQWLSMDREYQSAALALYAGRNREAAARFDAVARDPTSSWRASGLYLVARADVRQALADRTPAAYATARAAIEALSASPGARWRDQARGLEDVVDLNAAPTAFLASLQGKLDAPTLAPDVAVAFRDFTDLGKTAAAKPDALDWIDTLRAAPGRMSFDARGESSAQIAAREVMWYEAARTHALAHAGERWRAGGDAVWLVAALSLANADDPQTPELLRATDRVRSSEPAWISVQHHALRLTLARAPAAETRGRLDAILARRDLSASDRNVFAAQRAQVASSLADFARFATRRRLCPQGWSVDWPETKPPGCIRGRWDAGDVQPSGIYDGTKGLGSVALGDDARATIDRASLSDRIALAGDRRLPAALRLDVALTNYGRAVQLQNEAGINASATQLTSLIPLMSSRFRDVVTAKRGAAKWFAEFLVLAMIPGIRTDLIDYERPEGRRVVDFQGHWSDWGVLRRPVYRILPPRLVIYQARGTGFPSDASDTWPDSATDLTCLDECGRGAAPLRLPDFVRAQAARATEERGWFFRTDHDYGAPPPATPAGAVDAWDEMLAYARSHPADPRIPEALHWLVHVGHFGGSHEHSGRRAFMLLHTRYANSRWARATPFYND